MKTKSDDCDCNFSQTFNVRILVSSLLCHAYFRCPDLLVWRIFQLKLICIRILTWIPHQLLINPILKSFDNIHGIWLNRICFFFSCEYKTVNTARNFPCDVITDFGGKNLDCVSSMVKLFKSLGATFASYCSNKSFCKRSKFWLIGSNLSSSSGGATVATPADAFGLSQS